MGIRLIVVEPGAAAPVEKEFTSSPVRLGRNELNDVTLSDPFASEWHGVIRFDDQAVYYFDLGSLNGSTLGGKRLVKNTRSEEHTSELQSHVNLVCRLLLEKKKQIKLY